MNKLGYQQVIKFVVGEKSVTATMYDNEAARDFISLLPIQITLTDYANIEKVSDLPKRLNTSGAPVGYKPSVGEITYYSPWGNLAIFHKGFNYAGGLVPLGKIEKGIEILKRPGPIEVRIEHIS